MRSQFTRSLQLVLGIGLGFASSVFGQTTLGLVNGGGANDGDSVDGIYSSPYQMSLNTGTGPVNVAMDCDDWSDEIVDGQTWDVRSTSLSAITGGGTTSPLQPAEAVNPNVYWGSDAAPVNYDDGSSAVALTQEEKYVAAVYLAVELQNAGLTDTQRGELSLALWDIFNPNTTITGYGSPNSNIGTDPVAQSDLLTAITFGRDYTGGSVDGYTATVYTALASTSGYSSPGTETLTGGIASPGAAGVPQEFIGLTYVPEPSTWAFLGFDFGCAGIVGLYFRRRKARGVR